jgi:hypothetical protein
MTVAKPTCSGEDQARSGGYSITSSTTDTVYWCFGMSANNRVLKIVNDRRYPLEVVHPNLSVLQGGSVDWAQLESFSHFGSGQNTIIAPGDQVTYQVNVPVPGQGGIQTQMDGMGQSLYALQTGVEALVEILTRFGAGSGSAGFDTVGKFLGITSCADSMGKGPGAIVSGCFSPSDLLKAFGTTGLLLAPVVAVGALVAFFHSEWNSLVDQFNGHDKYTVTISRTPAVQAPVQATEADLKADAARFGETACGQDSHSPDGTPNGQPPDLYVSGMSCSQALELMDYQFVLGEITFSGNQYNCNGFQDGLVLCAAGTTTVNDPSAVFAGAHAREVPVGGAMTPST